MTDPPLVYLDSAPVIYRAEQKAPWFARVTAAFAERERTLAASELTRLECKVQPMRNGNSELVRTYERYFNTLELLPMTRAVFERVTDLRATHTLKTPDALHLACAIENGCAEFWTNDGRLTAAVPADLFVRVFAEAVDAPTGAADT